jgi:hypothetical protein
LTEIKQKNGSADASRAFALHRKINIYLFNITGYKYDLFLPVKVKRGETSNNHWYSGNTVIPAD